MKENIYRDWEIKDLTKEDIGKTITVSGWIENIRDHGGVLFLDLRDTTDTLQIVSNDDTIFAHLSKESVIKVSGVIRHRSEETYNPKLKTGEIELLVSSLEVLSRSLSVLPFDIRTSKKVSEDTRLKYRYLDLRNKEVQKNFKLRSDVLHFLRNKMYDLGFTEVQTPILTASSQKELETL